MKRTIACVAALLPLLAAGICQAAAPPLQEGTWETTMETTMEGLPFAIPPTVVKTKQCLTKKDMIPKDENQKDCTISKQKLSGNKATWEFECNQEGSKMTGKGEVAYTGTSSSGTLTSRMVSEGRTMTATTRLTGKRLGPCTGAEDSMEVNGQDVKKLKEQADQAMEYQRQLNAQMEATRQRSLALIEKIHIPAEKADACDHKGFEASMSTTEAAPAAAPAAESDAAPAFPAKKVKKARKALKNGDKGEEAGTAMTACDERLGPLAIKAGEWEITTEGTTVTSYPTEGKAETKTKTRARSKAKAREKVKEEDRTSYTDVSTETKKACLSPDSEPLVGKQMKRSGNMVTWKSAETRDAGNVTLREENEGGVEYQGDSFEGGKIHRYMNTTTYTRVTGKRLGDGNCISRGRESSSKPISAKPGGDNSPAEVIDKSTRKLKSLFGF